jgi:hypothetical protein
MVLPSTHTIKITGRQFDFIVPEENKKSSAAGTTSRKDPLLQKRYIRAFHRGKDAFREPGRSYRV